MKLYELSGAHIGRTVTVTTPAAVVVGLLYEISSEGEQVKLEGGYRKPVTLASARIRVRLRIGAFEARNMDPMFDVEIGE